MPSAILSPSTALEELNTVKQAALTCTACRLHETRTNVVFSDGNPQADILFIGEGPGQTEDETGLPFVGRSGKQLTELIEMVGFNRQQDTYICNIVKCRPPQNREPMADEAEACKGYLHAQIELVAPKIIVLVGKTAYRGIFQPKQKNIAIGKIRGQWLPSPFANTEVMTIFHPSYLLRNPQWTEGSPKWQTYQDLVAIRQRYDALGLKATHPLNIRSEFA